MACKRLERENVQLRKSEDRHKIKTMKAGCQREASSLKEADLEGSLPPSLIVLLGESNYRSWCDTNVDSNVPLMLTTSVWWPGSNSATQAEKSACDCLKDVLKHTVLLPQPISNLGTLAARPWPWPQICAHSLTLICRAWPWALAPALCELKIPDTACPALPYEAPLLLFANCQWQC